MGFPELVGTAEPAGFNENGFSLLSFQRHACRSRTLKCNSAFSFPNGCGVPRRWAFVGGGLAQQGSQVRQHGCLWIQGLAASFSPPDGVPVAGKDSETLSSLHWDPALCPGDTGRQTQGSCPVESLCHSASLLSPFFCSLKGGITTPWRVPDRARGAE